MNNAYFLRHGKVPANVSEVTNDCNMDEDLDDEHLIEFEQEDFISQILSVNPDVIYSSDLKRAKQTAKKTVKIIKKHTWKVIQIILDPDLEEQDYWEFSWKSHKELKKLFPQYNGPNITQLYRNHNKKWESWLLFSTRIMNSYCKIVKKNEWKTVLIVAHGWVYRVLYQHMHKISTEELLTQNKKYKLANLWIARIMHENCCSLWEVIWM